MLSLVSIYKATMKKDDLWINVYINFGSEECDVTTAQEMQLDEEEDVHNVFETKKKKKKHKQ